MSLALAGKQSGAKTRGEGEIVVTEYNAGPVVSAPMEIEPDWIDFNDHLNMAYYMVLFDRWLGVAFEQLGMGPDYAQLGPFSTFAGDAHIAYLREVRSNDQVICTFQILDHSDRAIHSFQEMRHAEEGWLAAVTETVTLHVDRTVPKVHAFPDDVAAKVAAMACTHAKLARPEHAGRTVGIRRKARAR